MRVEARGRNLGLRRRRREESWHRPAGAVTPSGRVGVVAVPEIAEGIKIRQRLAAFIDHVGASLKLSTTSALLASRKRIDLSGDHASVNSPSGVVVVRCAQKVRSA